ncbi:MAG TPA: hypothetical protein VLW17_09400 [Thermoanaerobaculaceae bacterium]|nr:hypothetical protein [Thermoanaerobaculaceae bacterium]
MTLVTMAMYAAVVVAVGVGAFLLVRYIAREMRRSSLPYVKRAERDRRQARARVAVERRHGPRRQDEIAGQFLAGLAGRSMARRAARRSPRGSGQPSRRSA